MGPPKGAAEIIEDAFAPFSTVGSGLKRIACPEGLILMVFKQDTVD